MTIYKGHALIHPHNLAGSIFLGNFLTALQYKTAFIKGTASFINVEYATEP